MDSKILKIFLIALLILLAFISGLLLQKFVLTGSAVADINNISDNEYSWTRAICNDNNDCLDILISCKNGNVIDIKPASDFVRYPLQWEDLREEENLCD